MTIMLVITVVTDVAIQWRIYSIYLCYKRHIPWKVWMDLNIHRQFMTQFSNLLTPIEFLRCELPLILV